MTFWKCLLICLWNFYVLYIPSIFLFKCLIIDIIILALNMKCFNWCNSKLEANCVNYIKFLVSLSILYLKLKGSFIIYNLADDLFIITMLLSKSTIMSDIFFSFSSISYIFIYSILKISFHSILSSCFFFSIHPMRFLSFYDLLGYLGK